MNWYFEEPNFTALNHTFKKQNLEKVLFLQKPSKKKPFLILNLKNMQKAWCLNVHTAQDMYLY